MASPGWYPDPNDAAWQQFYDGHQWTGQRRPVGTEDSPPAAPPVPGPTPEADQTQQVPLGQPVQPNQPVPTTQLPPAGEPGQQPWGAQPLAWQEPAAPQWQQPAPPQPPAPPQWQQPPGGQWQQPSGPQQWDQPAWAAGPPPRRRSRAPLIITLVVVVVAGLAVGGVFLFKGKSSPAFTFDGKAVDKPDETLSQAGSIVDSLVTSRRGAKNKDTRCYYAVPDQPAQNAKASDIDHSAWCGPVLFVDGSADKQYLRLSLNSQTASGGKVQLTPSDKPASDAPEAVPAGLNLKRPDNASAPGGNGGLSVPAPPPADKNAVVSADIGQQSVPAAPSGAAMGTGGGGAALTKLGPVKRYGSGDSARSAPDGQKLIAFVLAGTDDDDGDPALLSSSLTISVDGGAGRKLPDGVSGQPFVAAVPNSARSVDLVLTTSTAKQTVSLLNGKPGAGNIKLYARSHREQLLLKTGSFTFRFSESVGFPDGSSGATESGTYRSTGASLRYAIPAKHAKASGPSKALLYVDVGYGATHSLGSNFGFPPALMTFTPRGGRPIKARNVGSTGIYNVFEVPADLTGGTLRIAGSYTSTFSNSSNSYTTTLAAPITLPVSIPAG